MTDHLVPFIAAKTEEMIAIVAAMPDDVANASPGIDGGNSAYQLLTHTLGMMRQWVFETVLGRDVERDRSAEFTAAGEVAELVERARRELATVVDALADVDPATAPQRPRRERWAFWGDTNQGVLLHVFEEVCQHLGHLEITRDVLAAAAAEG